MEQHPVLYTKIVQVYLMPLQYAGISAGVFDGSHMGLFILEGKKRARPRSESILPVRRLTVG